MAIRVSNGTLKRTTKCMCSFRCLNDETRDVCPVDRCIQDDFCFVKEGKEYECSYRTPFGYSYI
jgi:hypothetical protein